MQERYQHCFSLLHANHASKALELSCALLADAPADPSILALHGAALMAVKRYAEAMPLFQRALDADPAYHEARFHLATTQRRQGLVDEAERNLQRLLKEQPDDARFAVNYSSLLIDKKDFQHALAVLIPFHNDPREQDAIAINRANALRALGEARVAKELYRFVIDRNGKYAADAAANLAMLELHDDKQSSTQTLLNLHEQGTLPAEGYVQLAALTLDSDRVACGRYLQIAAEQGLRSPHFCLMWMQYTSKEDGIGPTADYMADCQNLYKSIPADLYAKWMALAQVFCDYPHIAQAEAALKQEISNKKNTFSFSSLFTFLSYAGLTRKQFRDIATRTGALLYNTELADFSHTPRTGSKLRIGYMSADFRDHPIAHLMLGVLKCHDRENFEIYAYNIGPKIPTIYRYRGIASVDVFRDVHKMPARDLAQRMYDDKIDVLIDLCGYTENCIPQVLCHKPAPVIISYLGFVGTMGLPAVDYIIADAVVIPRKLSNAYVEKPIYLPRCYQATDGTLHIASVPRTEFGLPENRFVFASLNNSYKLSAVFVGYWAEILRRCPEAVILLYAHPGDTQNNLLAEFARLGVAAERIVFFQRQPKERFLAALACCDCFLDSSPYNAGTTASDALYAGCPVLTLPGKTYSSRMCASIVTHAGLAEMVCKDTEDYIAKAVRLYSDPTWQTSIRAKAEHARHTRLFDTQDAARCLEAAYRAAYARFAAGQKAGPITIEMPDWHEKQVQDAPFASTHLTRHDIQDICRRLELMEDQNTNTKDKNENSENENSAVSEFLACLSANIPANTIRAKETMKHVLHVGCGPQHILGCFGFNAEHWKECRLDINPDVQPDVVGSMTDMSAVATNSMDAVYSSHNIEHLYAHEVPLALREFWRVLKSDGVLVLTCPDLQSVCALVAEDKLLEPAYTSPAGPIAPLDILYGHRPPMAAGNLFMAHKCGFTRRALSETLSQCGFVKVASVAVPEQFALFSLASKSERSDEELRELAQKHFSFGASPTVK